jgi:hypothetical protein
MNEHTPYYAIYNSSILKWDKVSRQVHIYLFIEVPGNLLVPSTRVFLYWFTLEDGTDRYPETWENNRNLHCVTSQKSECLSYTAADVRHHVLVKYLPRMPRRYGNDALKYHSIPYNDNIVHLWTPEKLCGNWGRDIMVLNDVTSTDYKRRRPCSKRGV